MKPVTKTIEGLENNAAGMLPFVLSFFFSATLRTFLEVLSDPDTQGPSLAHYAHMYLYYATLALSLILVFHMLTRETIRLTARVVLPSFLVLNVAPVMDLLLSGGRGYDLSYLGPGVHDDLARRFVTFFGSFDVRGVTPGVRVEIGLVLIGTFLYVRHKTASWGKSLLSVLLTYTLIFAFMAMPFWVRASQQLLGVEGMPTNRPMLAFYLLLIFVLGSLTAYRADPSRFLALGADIRPLRLIHYELMVVLGVVLGLRGFSYKSNFDNVFDFWLLPIAILFAWWHAVLLNNSADVAIDTVSNPSRPIVMEAIDSRTAVQVSWLLLLLSLTYAAVVGFWPFFSMLLFAGNWFLYSMPPLRLKRVPFFSKLTIGLNSLILIILGYTVVRDTIEQFPMDLGLVLLIGFTAAGNFIDLKDYEGDKRAGIKTLPVLLGQRTSKLVIGMLFLLSYLGIWFVLREPWALGVAALLGVVQFWLINQKHYRERPVFLVYLFSLILLAFVYRVR